MTRGFSTTEDLSTSQLNESWDQQS